MLDFITRAITIASSCIIQPWIAWGRHNGAANYLYLDGHATTLNWAAAIVDMYPDKKVLTQDNSYP